MTLQATYSTTTPAFRLTTTPDSGVALPLTDPSALGNRPLAAFLQATTHDVRWTVDGTTPTSSHGMVLTAGAAPFLYAGDLSALRFIQSASGSVLNVVYAGIADTVGPQGPPGIQGATGTAGTIYPFNAASLAAIGVESYVDVLISASGGIDCELINAPFLDQSGTGPGRVAIPAPAAGYMNVVTGLQSVTTPGDAWQASSIAILTYKDQTGRNISASIYNPGDSLAGDNYPINWQPVSGTNQNVTRNVADFDAQPIVVWTQEDISDNGGGHGTVIGTKSLLLRLFYKVVPTA